MKPFLSLYALQFKQVLIALDQFLGALFGLILFPLTRSIFWADETISSWAYRAWRAGKWYGFVMHIINLLFFWQAEAGRWYWYGLHCKQAYISEQIGRQQTPELRNNRGL